MADLKVLVICGYKNTGKTTMASYLISTLSQRGYKIGSIKHDGHDFDIDFPYDNILHYQSGARQSVVFSNSRYMMIVDKKMTIDELLLSFEDNDLVIIEGMKNSRFHKIEMLRKGYSEHPVSNKENRIALISDFSLESDEKVFDFVDKEKIADFIEDTFFKEGVMFNKT